MLGEILGLSAGLTSMLFDTLPRFLIARDFESIFFEVGKFAPSGEFIAEVDVIAI
jgi:hypothetical protein